MQRREFAALFATNGRPHGDCESTSRRGGRGAPAGPRGRGARCRVPQRDEGLRRRLGRRRPGFDANRTRRVRLPRRAHRLRQVDLHPPAAEGARAEQGRDRDRRPHAWRDPPRARAVSAPQHRGRVPGLQAAAEPHGLRQRRLLAAGDRRGTPADPPQGAGHPAPRRPVDEAPQLPRRAVGRRAAARLDRAGVRQPSAAPARRRAHGQPRPRDIDRDHAADLPDQPDRHDRRGGHPRQGDGRQDAPARDRAARGPFGARREVRPLPARRVDDRVRDPAARRARRGGRGAPQLS